MTIREVIIIGSGSAGYAAAVYCARGNLKPLLFAGQTPGGQLMITNDVENYPGFDFISGPELMDKLKQHALKFETEINDEHIVDIQVCIENNKQHFEIKDTKDKIYKTYTVIIATGANAKWLELESEIKYKGHGVSGCATCDAFFYRDKIVCVVGGGNAAVEEALFLTRFASKVYLIHRRDSLRAEKILQDRFLSNDKIQPIWNSTVEEILGTGEGNERKVTGIKIKNTVDCLETEIPLDGVFIAIGHIPNSDPFKHIVHVTDSQFIKIQPGTTLTNMPGIFAAGDVADERYQQAITAAGTGCMAALDAIDYLDELHF